MSQAMHLKIRCKMLKVAHTICTNFQIVILCKTAIVPKGFCLVQSDLKRAFWAEKRELMLWHFKSTKAKEQYQSMPKTFLNMFWDQCLSGAEGTKSKNDKTWEIFPIRSSTGNFLSKNGQKRELWGNYIFW